MFFFDWAFGSGLGAYFTVLYHRLYFTSVDFWKAHVVLHRLHRAGELTECNF
jgi:hypothetical protein